MRESARRLLSRAEALLPPAQGRDPRLDFLDLDAIAAIRQSLYVVLLEPEQRTAEDAEAYAALVQIAGGNAGRLRASAQAEARRRENERE
jgi:hypothetical protein